MNNSSVRYSLAVLLSIAGIGAIACGRHITWTVEGIGFNQTVTVWDICEHDDHDDSQPVLVVPNDAESLELIARQFSRYL